MPIFEGAALFKELVGSFKSAYFKTHDFSYFQKWRKKLLRCAIIYDVSAPSPIFWL